MSESNYPQVNAIERVELEHEHLRELLGDIHKNLCEPAAEVELVVEQLRTLCGKLESHFQTEEEEGFFTQITEQAPRLADQATLLCEEHIEMLDEAKSIAAKAEHCKKPLDLLCEVKPAFHEFSKQLMHHESEENEMLQKAYWEDIGPGD